MGRPHQISRENNTSSPYQLIRPTSKVHRGVKRVKFVQHHRSHIERDVLLGWPTLLIGFTAGSSFLVPDQIDGTSCVCVCVRAQQLLKRDYWIQLYNPLQQQQHQCLNLQHFSADYCTTLGFSHGQGANDDDHDVTAGLAKSKSARILAKGVLCDIQVLLDYRIKA